MGCCSQIGLDTFHSKPLGGVVSSWGEKDSSKHKLTFSCLFDVFTGTTKVEVKYELIDVTH